MSELDIQKCTSCIYINSCRIGQKVNEGNSEKERGKIDELSVMRIRKTLNPEDKCPEPYLSMEAGSAL